MFACLGAAGMAVVYGLKVNLSVAIVAMVNHTANVEAEDNERNGTFEDDEHRLGNVNKTAQVRERNMRHIDAIVRLQDGPFVWTAPEQGLLLGAYFWGYFVTQIPGGRAADVLGGKRVFLSAVAAKAAGTLATPVAAAAGLKWLIVVRVAEGLAGGLTFPAMNVLVAKWAPEAELSSVASIVFGGEFYVHLVGHLYGRLSQAPPWGRSWPCPARA